MASKRRPVWIGLAFATMGFLMFVAAANAESLKGQIACVLLGIVWWVGYWYWYWCFHVEPEGSTGPR